MELTGSAEAILNCPENILEEGLGHVIHIFQNVPGEAQAFKYCSQGDDPGHSQGHSRTSPPLCEFIKRKLRLLTQYNPRCGTTALLLSSTGRTLHGEGPRQEKRPCWRLPLLLGCCLTCTHHTLASDISQHLHHRWPHPKCLPL